MAFKALLELVHKIVSKPTYENKQKLPAFSKEVATCVGEVVHAAEVLKGETVSLQLRLSISGFVSQLWRKIQNGVFEVTRD